MHQIDSDMVNAASWGDLEKVKELICKGANLKSSNNLAFKLAAECGRLDVVKYLVSQGADVDKAESNYCLRMAALNGHLDMVKYLVSQGADVRAEDSLALRWAERHNHKEIVNFLKLCLKTDKLSKMLLEGLMKDVSE